MATAAMNQSASRDVERAMAKTRKKKTKAGRKRAPWKRGNPRQKAGKPAHHLTRKQKTKAKRRARRAGRPYPNLVDNMQVAAQATRRRKRKTAARKTR